MAQKILFIDDDRYFARLYKAALEKTFDVVMCFDALSAVKYFNEDENISGAVIDIMMPPPVGYEAECRDGNLTGLWVLQQSSQMIVERKIAIIVFTNARLKFIADEIQTMGFPANLVSIQSKAAVLADNLPVVLEAALARR